MTLNLNDAVDAKAGEAGSGVLLRIRLLPGQLKRNCWRRSRGRVIYVAKKIPARSKDALIRVELGVGVSGCTCNNLNRKYFYVYILDLHAHD